MNTISNITELNRTITTSPHTHTHTTDNELEFKKKERKLERDHRLHLFGRIYKISNTVDNLIYIGSTVKTIEDRFVRHKRDAHNGSTCALHFHMRALGFEQFTIIEVDEVKLVTLNELHIIESKHMTVYKSVFNGLNFNYASRMCHHELALKHCGDCNVGIVCEHCSNRRWCFDCKYIEQTLRICRHYKLRACCHVCNKCKFCNAICTEEHVLTKEHEQRKIRSNALDAIRDYMREQKCLQSTLYKRAGFSHEQFKILTTRKRKRLGKVTLQRLNRKQINVIRPAWEVYLELVNQAEN